LLAAETNGLAAARTCEQRDGTLGVGERYDVERVATVRDANSKTARRAPRALQ
jgi:hypothetical protein